MLPGRVWVYSLGSTLSVLLSGSSVASGMSGVAGTSRA